MGCDRGVVQEAPRPADLNRDRGRIKLKAGRLVAIALERFLRVEHAAAEAVYLVSRKNRESGISEGRTRVMGVPGFDDDYV